MCAVLQLNSAAAVKVNPTNAFFVQVSCFKVLLVRGGH